MENCLIYKVTSVKPLKDLKIEVRFDNNVIRIYDCHRMLIYPSFEKLVNNALFLSVQVDPGGHGISWDDELDISEYELWENSVTY